MPADPATLDPSQPKDAHILERLERNIIIWITSVRPDGRPHSVPVWFLWDNDSVLIFSRPDQKIKNLRANPAVVLALDNTAEGDDVILFEGTATLLDAAEVSTAHPAYAAKYQALLDRFQWTPESMAQDYNQPIRITPTRFLFR
jgi:PPOX class probable F420-dependent enzyme